MQQMRALRVVAVLFVLLAAGCGPVPLRPAVKASPPAAPSASQVMQLYGQLPLAFEPNAGQSAPEVDFLARGPGYTVFLTATAAVLALRTPDDAGSALRLELIGATPTSQPTGQAQLTGTVSYFRGSDPARWQAGLPTYGRVVYPAVWPGIDVVYYGRDGQLEYDFIVAPGASPEQARVRVDGATGLELDPDGALLLHATAGTVRQPAPVIYQDGDDGREPVSGGYLLEGTEVRLWVGPYDPTRPLVIDPALLYSTYLGGSEADRAFGIAVDGNGQAYVTGSTFSSNFPTTSGAFDTTSNSGDTDAFVAKLNAAGTALVYGTYLGGNNRTGGAGIAVDASGQAHVTGITGSADFPTTPGAFDTTRNSGIDAFVAKLNAAGTALVYGTHLGGSGGAGGNGIAVDTSGQAYVAGETASADFPTTPGAFDTTPNSASDAFVAKLNAAGTALVYSTFLGGSGADRAFGIALDASGQAHVTGITGSTNFPTTPGAFDTTFNGTNNAFVAKLNAAGTALVYSTFLGGSAYDQGNGIAVDGSGQAYVTGFASSTNFPTTPGAFDTTLNSVSDAFVAKLNAAGTALVYSTYLGGSAYSQGNGIAVDGSGQPYVAGETVATDFPTTPGAFDTTANGRGEAFVTKLDLRAPVARTTVGSLAYAENAGPVAVDPGLIVADPDSANLTGATVQITGGFQSGEDSLAFANKLGISGSYNPATALLTLTGTTTVANYQTALRSVTYANSSDTPSAATRTIALRVTDETARTSGPGTRNVAVTAVNDPPTNTVPGAQSTPHNTPEVFSAANGNAITIGDRDALSADVRTTVAVSSGTLTLGAAGTAPPLTSVTGNGTASVVLVGTLAEITVALNGLTFTPSSGFGGAVTLTVTTNDLGNTGSGGPLQDQDVAQIAVAAPPSPCSPRPRVTQTLAAGGSALNVQVQPTTLSNGAGNTLQRIVFGTFQNATVTMNGQAVSSGQSVTLPAGTTSASLVVRRAVAGQPATVHFTIVDGCGEWKTFVGGGTAAGF
jgi:hypothetical protein